MQSAMVTAESGRSAFVAIPPLTRTEAARVENDCRGSRSNSDHIFLGDGLPLANNEAHTDSAEINAQTGSNDHKIGDTLQV